MNRYMALAAGAASVFAIGAHAYDNATVYNNAAYPASVTVKYAACKADTFTVPPKVLGGPSGKATAPSRRGACLITSISGRLNGANYPITTYTSSGTSYSLFLIRYGGSGTYRIYSSHETGIEGNWQGFLDETMDPEGKLKPSVIPHGGRGGK